MAVPPFPVAPFDTMPARRPVAIAPEFPGVISQTLLPLAAIVLCRVFFAVLPHLVFVTVE
jgi:hypothetical protein